MSQIPTITLSHGAVMPRVGLGTSPMNDADAERAVSVALELGYRLVDTAENYRNEVGVGRALRGVPREEVFVTSKFNKQWHSIEGPRTAFEASAEKAVSWSRVRTKFTSITGWSQPALMFPVIPWTKDIDASNELSRPRSTRVISRFFIRPSLPRVSSPGEP